MKIHKGYYIPAPEEDVIKLNTIIQGDCLKIMKTFPDKSIDLILTDPPYGVELKYDIYNDSEESWFHLMFSFIPEARRIAKMVIFPSCQIRRLDWFYRNHRPDWLICWYKGSVGAMSPLGFNDWEPLIVYGRTDKLSMHDYFQATNNEKKGNYGHPCPKPIKWANWLISRSTKEGMIVMDPFAGSGTTLVSAKQLGRKYIGIEISPKYCKIANERLAQGVLF